MFALDLPRYLTPLLITDAATRVAPGFGARADIVQNAIGLRREMGPDLPTVASSGPADLGFQTLGVFIWRRR